MSWSNRLAEYQALAASVEPAARVRTKDSWGWEALWWTGAFLTLGLLALGISLRRFLEDFATTFVTILAFPAKWTSLSVVIVLHEARHCTQATWFGWIFFPLAWVNRTLRAWLGLPVFGAVYLLLPVPIYFAAGRFYLELDADRAAWREALHRGAVTPAEVRARAKRRAKSLSSGAYAWAWPASWARRAYARAAEVEISRSLPAAA